MINVHNFIKQESNISVSFFRFQRLRIFAFLLITLSVQSFAIDNPDSPDLIAEFEVKEKSLIAAAENSNNGYRENLIAYTDYLTFLDKELNIAYQALQSKLPTDNQQQLKQAQLAWLKYRDLEFSFIESTWTREAYGSSSSITRGQYKTTVVRNRIMQLLHYAKAH